MYCISCCGQPSRGYPPARLLSCNITNSRRKINQRLPECYTEVRTQFSPKKLSYLVRLLTGW